MKNKIFTLLLPLLLFAGEENPLPLFVTQHEILLENGPLAYEATTGIIEIGDDPETAASLFFLSYTTGDPDRPITFVFPGGPGSAGTLEAIVSLGPRRLLTAAEGRRILPPYRMIDNPETLLATTDIVFVDPVGSGYSRAESDELLPYFYSTEGDIQTLGEFVHAYVSLFDRWNSPKYLSGGSYGTLRCCGLAENLLQYDLWIHGILLHGCAFQSSTLSSERDHFLPDAFLIPTFAATAWRHGRLWPEKTLEETIDYARRFVYDAYIPAMLQPSRLSLPEQASFYQQLAHLIGLPLDTVRKYLGRINETLYTAEFFAPDRKLLGGLDTRYSGDFDTIAPARQDPSYLDSLGIGAAFQSYLQTELETPPLAPKYISFSWETLQQWRTAAYDTQGEPDLLQRLRRVMIYNPFMKVFVGAGLYDCRTPFAAVEYCFDHLNLSPSTQNRLQFEYYPAGHAFIFDLPSLQKFKRDLTRFYQE